MMRISYFNNKTRLIEVAFVDYVCIHFDDKEIIEINIHDDNKAITISKSHFENNQIKVSPYCANKIKVE
jgi:hypothetical protein